MAFSTKNEIKNSIRHFIENEIIRTKGPLTSETSVFPQWSSLENDFIKYSLSACFDSL